ncbi:MAG: ABC transporter ATP-binding protein [Treponemataceae bacterium]
MDLSLENIDFSYGEESLFSNFSFTVTLSGVHAVLGPSGCGKTTLLHLIAGLRQPSAGEIKNRPSVGYLFQEPRLLPWRTVTQNVEIPISQVFGENEARKRALRFLDLVGLSGKENAYPEKLSGGQRQRAAMARAFAYPAPLILLDEPFQSLDLPLRLQLMDLFKKLLIVEPRAAVIVTHDPREAIYLADRVAVLSGKPAQVVLDERITLSLTERAYSSSAAAELEATLFAALTPAFL